MAQNKNKKLQLATLRTARLGFVFTAIYAISVAIYQAWKLITPELIQTRWTIVAVLFGVNCVLWWSSRSPKFTNLYYKGIIFLQIITYITLAGYMIYAERGMASNAIILFVIPIVIAATELSTIALATTATLAVTTYAYSAIHYFNQFPSEGYKVELYGGIVFYGAVLYFISALLWVVIRINSKKPL
jgi:hypothetical protein